MLLAHGFGTWLAVPQGTQDLFLPQGHFQIVGAICRVGGLGSLVWSEAAVPWAAADLSLTLLFTAHRHPV